MKTVLTQDVPTQRARFKFDPDRHYVVMEKVGENDDAVGLDFLLDQQLPDGTDAYRIEEVTAQSEPMIRRVVGSRRGLLLSCLKSHSDSEIKKYSDQSKHIASAPDARSKLSGNTSVEEYESTQVQDAIRIADMPSREKLEALRNS